MALFTKENVERISHWLKLRRLAFRFDRKTKVICLLALLVPAMFSIGSTPGLVLSVCFAALVFLVLPVLTGFGVLRVIRERFGVPVADEALIRCEFSKYASNRTFTIGDIQRDLEKRADREQATDQES